MGDVFSSQRGAGAQQPTHSGVEDAAVLVSVWKGSEYEIGLRCETHWSRQLSGVQPREGGSPATSSLSSRVHTGMVSASVSMRKIDKIKKQAADNRGDAMEGRKSSKWEVRITQASPIPKLSPPSPSIPIQYAPVRL